LLSIQRRAIKGVTVNANYTWSHCIGPYGSGLYSTAGLNPNVTNSVPNNRNADQGDCPSDRRQIFNLTSVAETPQFTNRTIRIVGTGWRLSGIYRWSSGDPLNILSGQDRALSGTSNQRVDQISAGGYTGSAAPLKNYLNPAAFALPALGTYGKMRFDGLAGPAVWSFDVALSRGFQIQERQRVEFRAEAFNVTNSFRPQDPTTSLTSNTFGQIRSSYDPRIMQFALKYVF
jgi:hypothetical protein